ncbi:MAG: HAD family hydrolase [Syntrophorhabdaceae bacterium]|nr:HAD family hydrolase [Syntrophorhabdaceae bacterium]
MIKLLAMTKDIERKSEKKGSIERWVPFPVDCVIYDCDGVLFDSLEANSRLYNHIATSMGRAPLTGEEVYYCHTHTVHESIRYMFRGDEELGNKALNFLKQNVDMVQFISYLKMEPNLMEVLQILKERGIKRAICTNRTTTMGPIMERFGLRPFFDVVVTALDTSKPKPDPESVSIIIQKLNVEKDRVLYIGDSEVDMETAGSSGVRFIAYKNPSLKADGYIDDHLSLLTFLSNGKSLPG